MLRFGFFDYYHLWNSPLTSISQIRAYLKKGRHHFKLVCSSLDDKHCEQNYLVMLFRKFYWFHHILQLLQHTPAPRARQVNSKRLHMLRDIKISQRCGEKSMCATFI